MRETFQKVPIVSSTPAASADGGVDDEDPDPDEDSPPSGPDAGGGEADAVLPSSEWEVQASSANYTMSQVDLDRCECVRGACGVNTCVILFGVVAACAEGPRRLCWGNYAAAH